MNNLPLEANSGRVTDRGKEGYVREAHLAVADEGEPAIRNGDATGVAAEILQHLPTLPEAHQQRCIPEDNLLCLKFRGDPSRQLMAENNLTAVGSGRRRGPSRCPQEHQLRGMATTGWLAIIGAAAPQGVPEWEGGQLK